MQWREAVPAAVHVVNQHPKLNLNRQGHLRVRPAKEPRNILAVDHRKLLPRAPRALAWTRRRLRIDQGTERTIPFRWNSISAPALGRYRGVQLKYSLYRKLDRR